MQRQSFKRVFFFLNAAVLLVSCSLDYTDATANSISPELILHDVEFTRVEEGHVSVRLVANMIESYRTDNTFFADNIFFTALDKEGKLVSNGNARYLYADQNNEIYSMLGGVEINSPSFDTEVEAKNLRWNNKTEQLTSSRHDVVRLTRGALEKSVDDPSDETEETEETEESNQVFIIEGSGFSSDLFTQKISFNDYISGTIIEKSVDSVTEDEVSLEEEKVADKENLIDTDELIIKEQISIEELLKNDK